MQNGEGLESRCGQKACVKMISPLCLYMYFFKILKILKISKISKILKIWKIKSKQYNTYIDT